MTAPTLVLWDIDGTLIRAGAAARGAVDAAVALAIGRHPGDHGVVMGGKTDPQIAAEVLAACGLGADEAAALVADVVAHLEAELAGGAHRLVDGGRVLPGVEALLAGLHADPDVHQSVLTGNTRANAATKLRAFGLDHWLDLETGAYGSDDPDRCALVPIARQRARHLRRLDVAPRDVWVVGDTPRDLDCARAGGARCLLVATGRVLADELRAAGPEAVLDDLADVPAVTRLLLGTADR